MKILYKNNAASTLDTGINDTALTLDVSAGDGSLFPSPAVAECFFVTLSNATSMEIVKVTHRTVDTFTIERAQEGTSAASFNSGDKVELLITAGIMEDLRDRSLRTEMPLSSVTPSRNGQLVFEATNNTTITVKYKGTDGTVRSGTITLS